MGNIFILDDEKGMRDFLEVMLKKDGYEVEVAASVEEAKKKIRKSVFDLVISDLKLKDGSGIDFIKYLKQTSPETFVIIITAFATLETAIDAIKLGAYDYILKPFKIEVLRNTIKNAFEKKALLEKNYYLKKEVGKKNVFGNLEYRDEKIKKLLDISKKAAMSDSNILITGESGVGKEMFARFIHNSSPRANELFVPINCGALPENLLESELFGYVAGAFTGATKNKDGLFVIANNGTIFLDEISETTNNFQVKLLRVIQEREVRPIGSSSVKKVNVRIIAASNKNLEVLMQKGEFRQDLFYRLNVIPIEIPPLRERKADIPFLAEYFLKIYGKGHKKLTNDAKELLLQYDFPGNVRELENIIERVSVLSNSNLITADDFSFLFISSNPKKDNGVKKLADVEFEYILEVLEKCNGNKTKAAELLGVSRRFIYKKLEERGMKN